MLIMINKMIITRVTPARDNFSSGMVVYSGVPSRYATHMNKFDVGGSFGPRWG